MTAQETLGTVLEGDQFRDAVHVAVLPLRAAHPLIPGQHVGLTSDGRASVEISDKIGIVDPYLARPLREDEKFWLFLYPRSVTTIRHMWSHPKVPNEGKPTPLAASVAWMKVYASAIGSTMEEVMEKAGNYVTGREFWNERDRFEGESVPDKFWDHYERITGTEVDENQKSNFFSCSC